jgi:hypothetical protein
VVQNEIESKKPNSCLKRSEIRRDPDSGKFIASDAPFDEMEQLFRDLERDVLGDFT